MKIKLLTNLGLVTETIRLKEEASIMGHDLEIINLSNFSFHYKKGRLTVPGLTDLDADLIIVRGILSSARPVSYLVADLRSRGVKVFDNNYLNHEYSIDKVTDLIKL